MKCENGFLLVKENAKFGRSMLSTKDRALKSLNEDMAVVRENMSFKWVLLLISSITQVK